MPDQQFVAFIYRGMVTDARAITGGENERDLQMLATAEAAKLNAELAGEAEGWGTVVVPIETLE